MRSLRSSRVPALGGRARPRLSRSPLIFWLAVAFLASVTAMVVAGALGRAGSLAARYGPLRPVVVVERPVERGATLADGDVSVRLVPSSLLPEGGFGSVDDVRGRAAIVPLVPGEPVVRARLAPDGVTGVAALLPAGTRALAVPAGSGSAPALVVGDAVDVLATLEGQPAVAVAVGALVVGVGEDSATLAVTPAEARAVAFALSAGAVTVVLAPGPEAGAGAGSSRTAGAQGQRAPLAATPSTIAPATSR